MDDRAFGAIRGLCRLRAWPPSALFPQGLGIPLVVDRELDPADSPVIRDGGKVGNSEIRLTPADYADLRERVDALHSV